MYLKKTTFYWKYFKVTEKFKNDIEKSQLPFIYNY